MAIVIHAKNLHEILGTIPVYSAYLLTGTNLNYKIQQHAYDALGNLRCRPCERFLYFYDEDVEIRYRIRPRHPACSIGIDIIRQHFQLHLVRMDKVIGRHTVSPLPEAA